MMWEKTPGLRKKMPGLREKLPGNGSKLTREFFTREFSTVVLVIFRNAYCDWGRKFNFCGYFLPRRHFLRQREKTFEVFFDAGVFFRREEITGVFLILMGSGRFFPRQMNDGKKFRSRRSRRPRITIASAQVSVKISISLRTCEKPQVGGAFFSAWLNEISGKKPNPPWAFPKIPPVGDQKSKF